jgi:CDP-2,3-bis-(O-geranylgeranyl)-sn-glycerol synthase
MLPVYFANMAPVIFKGIAKKLAFPVDFGGKINNKAIFGKNKTFRGIVFGVLSAIIIAFLQYLIYRYEFFSVISFIDYSNWFLVGLLMGSGAMIGDLFESFVKRRLNFASGRKFVPFDQLDFVIGGLLFVSIVVKLTLLIVITILIISFVLDIIVNHIAFYLKIRKEKW